MPCLYHSSSPVVWYPSDSLMCCWVLLITVAGKAVSGNETQQFILCTIYLMWVDKACCSALISYLNTLHRKVESSVCCVQAYGDAYNLVEKAKHVEPAAAFVIKNECGSYVTVKPGPTFQVRYKKFYIFLILSTHWTCLQFCPGLFCVYFILRIPVFLCIYVHFILKNCLLFVAECWYCYYYLDNDSCK